MHTNKHRPMYRISTRSYHRFKRLAYREYAHISFLKVDADLSTGFALPLSLDLRLRQTQRFNGVGTAGVRPLCPSSSCGEVDSDADDDDDDDGKTCWNGHRLAKIFGIFVNM